MHPNAFLKSFWRKEVIDQVFVAMSFDPRFTDRYNDIIKPAIEEEPISGVKLKAYRVDNSKTGDSILSDIVDGIAHSRLILADVSIVDEGRYTEASIRNGNVMYEVGLALACRNSSEVLLIRDDSKKFLFDVSTIPHLTMEFANKNTAIQMLREAISDRISETKLIEDARVRMAAEALTQDEVRLLKILGSLDPKYSCDLANTDLEMLSLPDQHGLDALIRKGCIQSFGINIKTGTITYKLNPFGYALAQFAEKKLKKFQSQKKEEMENSEN